MGIKFAVLGSGEKMYEDFFLEMAARYPRRVSVHTGFDSELAHRIYSGADMFLMPSQSEPCGLAQMIAMRYGTIPIVRETGGLRDTVRDNGGVNGNGFTFKTYNANDMLDAVKRAKRDYDDKEKWNQLVERAMKCDYSWSASADMYIEKTVHKMAKKNDIMVATSDRLEQMIIYGEGATRLSAREFIAEVERENEEIRNRFLKE